ncbi:MAG: EF-hand domain-containing protein [Chthoniobacter sp.]
MNLISLPIVNALLLVSVATLPAADGPAAPSATPPPATASRAPSLDELFTTLDQDHDGRISKEEANGAYAQRFAPWDANGDGFATRQEIHDYRQRLGIDDSGQRIAATATRGQRPTPKNAVVLKEPADWRLETMSVPPGFAPDVKLSGSEEIRFAPGCSITLPAPTSPARWRSWLTAHPRWARRRSRTSSKDTTGDSAPAGRSAARWSSIRPR